MRLSLFRSKSGTPTPSPTSSKRSNLFGHMLSPTKSKPDDPLSLHSSSTGLSPTAGNAASTSSNEQPSQDPPSGASNASDLPLLPSDGNDSLAGSSSAHNLSSNADDEGSSVNEPSMTRKLMDIESSFVPGPAAVSHPPTNPAASTTAPTEPQMSSAGYLSDTAKSSLPDRDRNRLPPISSEATSVQGSNAPLASSVDVLGPASTQSTSPTRPDSRLPQEDQLSQEDSSFAPSLGPLPLSSPAAAAAQRTKLRATNNSMGASRRFDSARSAARAQPAQESQNLPINSTSKQRQNDIVQEPDSASSLQQSQKYSQLHSSGNFEDSAPYQPRYTRRRPEHLQNRQSAQRASKDSFMSQKSETTIGPGYDGQSGDATPGTNARASRELSRLPSLGSIASSMSGGNEVVASRIRKSTPSASSMPKARASLDQMGEDNDEKSQPQSQLETPRASMQTAVRAPTNTVIAQHVRDVEVPETVAREYRAARRPTDPNQAESLNSTPFYGRGKTNLTLKEQNGKIDKLTKENFDLKLKIHYLYQALQDRSDEGVSDIISVNAQLQADLVKARKENQTLRKRLREVEGKQKGWENASASLQPSLEGSETDSSRANVQAQLEDEILYLRNQFQTLQQENSRLLEGGQPEWNTLDREIVRRKQAEREALELRQQVERLKGNGDRMPHLRIRPSNANLADSERGLTLEDRDATSLSGNTLVDQLKHENETLRRDLGAQTDMLSSRNRERERLQQEIEDLKLVHRRGDQAASAAGDSILDRSVSRAQQRSTSRASGSTRDSQLSDRDRDRVENIHASLRDEVSSLKMRNQDLQRELNSLAESAEHIQSLQTERDGATNALREADGDIDYLYEQMSQLEELVLQKEQDVASLEVELRDREEDSAALQRELKSLNESFNALADDSESNQATIQSLQQDIANANGELEAMESNLRDVTEAKDRLEVQQESAEGEIAFLREEQEADKLRIGDLQSALTSAKTGLRSEETRLREFEKLEAQASKARDEARGLRKSLTAKEAELSKLQGHFEELQATLDDAANDFESTKASLHKEISKLRSEAEQRLQELDQSHFDYDEKARLLRDREGLLELSGHETRRLTELLEKEKQGRKHDRNEFDRALRNVRGTPEARVAELEIANSQERKKLNDLSRNLSAQLQTRDALFLTLWNRLSGLCTSQKLMEPEQTSRSVESISSDMQAFEQHISTVIEAIETHVSGFRNQLLNTEKAVWKGFTSLELELNGREARIDALEKNMLELTEAQSERIEDNANTAEYLSRLKNENKLLKRELKYLKQGSFALPGLPSPHDETQRRRNFGLDEHSLSLNPPDQGVVNSSSKRRDRHSAAHGRSMLLRTHSASDSVSTKEAADDQQPSAPKAPQRSLSSFSAIQGIGPEPSAALGAPNGDTGSEQSGPTASSDQRWLLKLEALKRNLRQEREGRLLDRDGARKRLEEGKRQSEALKEELRREKLKTAAAGSMAKDAAGSTSGAEENAAA